MLPHVHPLRYVTIQLAEVVSGYTVAAMETKIQRGVWVEGCEWIRAPDGRIMIDLRGVERWVEGRSPGASGKKRERSDSTSPIEANG